MCWGNKSFQYCIIKPGCLWGSTHSLQRGGNSGRVDAPCACCWWKTHGTTMWPGNYTPRCFFHDNRCSLSFATCSEITEIAVFMRRKCFPAESDHELYTVRALGREWTCFTAIHQDGCWSTKSICLHCIQRSRGFFFQLKLEIGSHLNFSLSFWLKIIDLILFIQTAPKSSRGGPALLLCQWLMCRLYYIFDFLGDTSPRTLLSI